MKRIRRCEAYIPLNLQPLENYLSFSLYVSLSLFSFSTVIIPPFIQDFVQISTHTPYIYYIYRSRKLKTPFHQQGNTLQRESEKKKGQGVCRVFLTLSRIHLKSTNRTGDVRKRLEAKICKIRGCSLELK